MLKPGAPVRMNHGLLDPRAQEAQPSTPAVIVAVDQDAAVIQAPTGHRFYITPQRCRRLALVSPDPWA